MSRALLILDNPQARQKAVTWINKAPFGCRVEFKAPRRSTDQNSRFWAMLTDVASQLNWHGVKLSTNDWKLLFLDALKQEMRLVPNLNGNGFINLGRSSSDLSVAEMTELMDLIEAFGAQHGVTFSEPQATEQAA